MVSWVFEGFDWWICRLPVVVGGGGNFKLVVGLWILPLQFLEGCLNSQLERECSRLREDRSDPSRCVGSIILG